MDTMGFVEGEYGGSSQPMDLTALGLEGMPTFPTGLDPNAAAWNEEDTDTPQWAKVDNGDEDDAYNTAELPAHACRYCGCHDPMTVAKCNVCRKWFCNARTHASASHIILHLVRAHHKEISPHPEGPFGDAPLECYVCGSKNVFLLGFISSKQENIVVLICREPCLHSQTLKEMEWDADGWLPLIEDRQLLPWLVGVPSSHITRRCRQITSTQIHQLEDLWKTMPEGTLEDIGRVTVGVELPEVPTVFKDGYHFQDSFTQLIAEECEASRKMKDQFSHDNVTVMWDTGVTGKRIAIFQFPAEENGRLTVGDEMLLLHKAQGWEGRGTLLRIQPSANAGNELHCEMKVSKDAIDPKITSGYSIKLVFKDVVFSRMRAALKTLATEDTSVSTAVYNILLGQTTEAKELSGTVPESIDAPNLAKLNYSQDSAVRSVLLKSLALIQGPPGTGKTLTSATIVYNLCQMHNSQILVCAPSNIAVDHLAGYIAKTGLNVLRISSKSREGIPSQVDQYMLHVQVRQFVANSPVHSELHKLQRLKDEVGDLNERDRKAHTLLMRKAESDLIANADVICTTCSCAGDPRLAAFRFKHVLVDETTQGTEPETLIPLVAGAKQVILVGDHCQLGPVIIHNPCEKAGLGRSMFERLVALGNRPVRLDVQYRMHPCISEFSSNNFYEGTLQNGVTAEDRDSSKYFPWPNPRKPMFFYNSIASEELGSSGTSYLNRTEAALAEKFVTALIKNGATPQMVGVITPYEGQRCYLLNYLQRNGPLPAEAYRHVEVASVDSFQGREKDFIIVTCVRSNDYQGIGFLRDWRRLNVALTRAKQGLIIIGNARVLGRNMLWNKLMTHFKNHSLIVDGPVMDLRPVDLAIPKPRPLDFPIGPQSIVPMYTHFSVTEDSSSVTDSDQAYLDVEYTPGMRIGAYTGLESAGTGPVSQASMSGSQDYYH